MKITGFLLALALGFRISQAHADIIGKDEFQWDVASIKVVMYDAKETSEILKGVKDRNLVLYTLTNTSYRPDLEAQGTDIINTNKLSGFNIGNLARVPPDDIQNQFGPVPATVARFDPNRFQVWIQDSFAGGKASNIEWDTPTGDGMGVGDVRKFGFTVPDGKYCLGPYPRNWVHSWGEHQSSPGRRFQVFLHFGPLAGPVPIRKIKLGEGTEGGTDAPLRSGDGCFKVYVPSRYGGTLTVATTAGQVQLFYKEARSKANLATFTKGAQVGGPAPSIAFKVEPGKFGWYFIEVLGDPASYQLTDSFVEKANVAEKHVSKAPWNFWYFPFNPAASAPHLFDNPGAYTKFDKVFGLGTQAFDEEVRIHQTATTDVTWAGHCWGASLASALVKQPEAVTRKGVTFTQDELEGLAADFFNNSDAGNLEFGWPFEKPTPADDDPTDKFAHKLQLHLRDLILTEKVPFHMNLRQADGDAAGGDQVWNQIVYKYSTRMVEDPEAVGDEETEKILEILHTTRFTANDDFFDPVTGSEGNPETDGKREEEAVFLLIYNPKGEHEGEVRGKAVAPKKQNWISLKNLSSGGADVFIPGSMFDVRKAAAREQKGIEGDNKFVTWERLKELGLESSGLKRPER